MGQNFRLTAKMKYSILKTFIYSVVLFSIFLGSCAEKKGNTETNEDRAKNLYIGWASADVTPDQPVDLRGQFPARISEGVLDPIMVTTLAMESVSDTSSEKGILISCDLNSINPELLTVVREKLKESLPEIRPDQIILNATHTHTAPYCSSENSLKNRYGVELMAMAPSAYQEFISTRIIKTIESAWKSRKPGGISFGLGHAVIGHNRLSVDNSGKSVMYRNTTSLDFSHLEGTDDHSVNLIYTWDRKNNLTGVVINVACPSQVSELEYLISADFWHDTRIEVSKQLGKGVFILPQCSAAGDQSPHIMVGAKAEERMQRLIGFDSTMTGRGSMGRRKQIALNLTGAVMSVLPYMRDNINWDPVFIHRTEIVNLSRRLISIGDVNSALEEAKVWQKKYEQMLLEIKDSSGFTEKPRWYSDITGTYRSLTRSQSVKERFELEKVQPKMPVELHVLRLGEMVMTTNPFELYLDYGNRIKGRSPAIQTFLIQLANGSDGYLPPSRSIAGGSYGAVPASTLIGPEGGQELVEKTLELVTSIWQTN